MDLTQYKIRVLVRKEVHGRPKRGRPHDIIGTVLSINPNNARTSKALDDELNIPSILCGIYADETYEADIMVRWDNDEKGEVWPGSILLVSTTIPICESLWGKGVLNRAPRKFVENELKPRTGKKVRLKTPSKNDWLDLGTTHYITVPKKDLEHLSGAISGITASYDEICNTNYTAEVENVVLHKVEPEPVPIPYPGPGRSREEKRMAFAYNYGRPIKEEQIERQVHRTQRAEVGKIRYNPQGRYSTKLVKRPDGRYEEIRISDLERANQDEEYKMIYRENPFKPDVHAYHGDRPVNNSRSVIQATAPMTKIDKRINEDGTITTTTRLIDPISNEVLHTEMEVVPYTTKSKERSFAKLAERAKDFKGFMTGGSKTGRSKSKTKNVFGIPKTEIRTRKFIDIDEEIGF